MRQDRITQAERQGCSGRLVLQDHTVYRQRDRGAVEWCGRLVLQDHTVYRQRDRGEVEWCGSQVLQDHRQRSIVLTQAGITLERP